MEIHHRVHNVGSQKIEGIQTKIICLHFFCTKVLNIFCLFPIFLYLVKLKLYPRGRGNPFSQVTWHCNSTSIPGSWNLNSPAYSLANSRQSGSNAQFCKSWQKLLMLCLVLSLPFFPICTLSAFLSCVYWYIIYFQFGSFSLTIELYKSARDRYAHIYLGKYVYISNYKLLLNYLLTVVIFEWILEKQVSLMGKWRTSEVSLGGYQKFHKPDEDKRGKIFLLGGGKWS